MVAVAVFDVISVKNVNITQMINTIADSGIDFRLLSWQLKYNDRPESYDEFFNI